MADQIPFEEALGELQQIVSALEAGQVSLEQSLSRFERGVALAAHCQSLLDEANQRVEIVVSRRAHTVETAPFEVTATYAPPAESSGPGIDTESGSTGKSRRKKADPDQRGLFS